jgi:hypothetical protein
MTIERATEVFAVVNLAVIGLSHIAQPKGWVEFFIFLRERGHAGVFFNGMLSLTFGSILVAFHKRVDGPADDRDGARMGSGPEGSALAGRAIDRPEDDDARVDRSGMGIPGCRRSARRLGRGDRLDVGPLTLPDAFHAVLSEDWIRRDDGELLAARLRRKESVEGIAVVKGQLRDIGDVLERRGQQVEAVDFDLLLKEPLDGPGNLELAETRLDGHLPAARDTQQTGRAGNRTARARRQTRIVTDPPQKCLRIEQERHFS